MSLHVAASINLYLPKIEPSFLPLYQALFGKMPALI